MLSSYFRCRLLNPATLLAVWMLVLFLAMNLSSPFGVYAAAVAAFLANISAPFHFRRLLKRSRWLLLSVALIFLLMTPGAALFSIAGFTALSFDGVQAALEQICRLVLALAMLACLLGRMNLSELIAGLHQLLSMLHLPGLDADRAALRLSLTLRRLEQDSQRNELQRWQSRFDADTGIENAPEAISLPAYPFRALDRLIIAIVLTVFLAIAVAAQIQPGEGVAL